MLVIKFPDREGKRKHKAMVSSRVLLFFVSAIFMLSAQAVAQPAFLYHFCMLDKGNYTGNSTYEANFNDLLFSLSSNTEIDHGFYNSTYGRNPDQVHAIGLCRGDVNPDVCRGCLNNAASLLTESCPRQKEAIGWYAECMLRYSNRSIHGVMETSPSFYMWNLNNISANSVNQFNDELRSLLERLKRQAVAGGSLRKFAAGNATAPNFQTLYALVQCTPDLSEEDCNSCLVGAIQNIPVCCDSKQGGRVITPSCNIRFEVYPFYNPTTPAWPTRKPTNTNKREVFAAQDNKGYPILIIIIFVLTGSVVALIIAMGVRMSVKYLCRRNNDGTTNEVHTRIVLESLQVNHGSEANKHGQGGYSINERYTRMMKKLSGMRKKKKGFFFTPNINEENEIQEHDLPIIPDGSSESDDDAVRQLLAERLRPPKRSRRPSASSSSRSSHVSQLTRELDEYKRRCEEAEREVHRQQEKISSVHREMQEEVNSIKRQQTQRQQEMETNQRQMEQQIQFLMSQLQLHRDPST